MRVNDAPLGQRPPQHPSGGPDLVEMGTMYVAFTGKKTVAANRSGKGGNWEF
jgi:hypothetical protein